MPQPRAAGKKRGGDAQRDSPGDGAGGVKLPPASGATAAAAAASATSQAGKKPPTPAPAALSTSSPDSSIVDRRPVPRGLKPATVDLSQCHNESLDLVRLLIGLYPQHLVEARTRLNHWAMHADYYDRLASLLWTGRAAAKSLENYARLSMRLGRVRTNHFPAIDDMCNKSYLARKLKFFERVCPGQYSFVPRTWMLPQEWDSFRADVIAATAASNAAKANAAAASAASAVAAAAAAAPSPATPAAPPTTAASSSASSSTTYIFKPSGGSQGSGIMLAQRLSDIERIYRQSIEEGASFVVQEYIARPLLLGGLKFDLRIYVMLESLEPLRFHLFRDGLARFCTEAYQPPSASNLKASFVHLTNASLNKQNTEHFKVALTSEWAAASGEGGAAAAASAPAAVKSKDGECKENNSSGANAGGSPSLASLLSSDLGVGSLSTDSDGSKRTIRTVLSQLRAEGHTSLTDDAFWAQIEDIVRKTLISLWAPMIANYRVAFPMHRASPEFPSACWHILGFDVMLDDFLRPWLLELNCSPSLNIESLVDLAVKKPMLEQALGILGYLGEERKRKWRTNVRGTEGVSEMSGDNESPAPATPAAPVESAPTPVLPSTLPIPQPASNNSASSSLSFSAAPIPRPPITIRIHNLSHTHSATAPSSATASPLDPADIGGGGGRRPALSPLTIPISLSTPGSGASTPKSFQRQLSTSSDGGGTGNSTAPNRSSPLTLPPLGSSLALPSSSASSTSSSSLPSIPVIPSFAHRRASSTSLLPSPLALARKYVLLPGGQIQPREDDPTSSASAAGSGTVTGAANESDSPNAPSSARPSSRASSSPSSSDDAEYMHICPAEEWAAERARRGLTAPDPTAHPLLFFSHTKIRAIFERYTAGSAIKKLSSSKFMQACVACKIAASNSLNATTLIKPTNGNSSSGSSGNPSNSSANSSTSTTVAPSTAAPRPLSNWPSRPDIDLLFLQHTKFEAVGVCGASIGNNPVSSKMLDFAGFCDVLFQIAETKYRPLIAAGHMNLREAFLAFVESLDMPEESAASRASAATAGATAQGREAAAPSKEQAARLAAQQIASSISAPPPSSFTSAPLRRVPLAAPAAVPLSATVGASCSLPPPLKSGSNLRSSFSSDSKDSSSPSPAPSSAAINLASTASPASLAATLSSLLASKDASSSVFNRLTGVAAPPISAAADSIKQKRKKRAQEGTYEAFLAAYQQQKTKNKK